MFNKIWNQDHILISTIHTLTKATAVICNYLQDVILKVHDDGKVFLRPCRPAFAERSPSLFQAQLSAATITAAAERRRGGKAAAAAAERQRRRRQGSQAQRPIGLFWLALGAANMRAAAAAVVA